jgi:uncharacterized CHY-type Zn-finger protein
MNEIEIRRMYISDECWERTSQSWKKLKPLRNFDEFKESDETKLECYNRLKNKFNIPLEVIEQWIYPHYYNKNSVNNYGWIDYSKSVFKTVSVNVETLKSLNIINEYKSYVRMRECSKPFNGFMCTHKDKEYWKEHQTWRVPPIVLDVNAFPKAPQYSEISAPMQLVEGHSRMGYLLSMYRSGFLQKHEHEIYLLTTNKNI